MRLIVNVKGAIVTKDRPRLGSLKIYALISASQTEDNSESEHSKLFKLRDNIPSP